jgi:hypothetical protein
MSAHTFDSHSVICPICNRSRPMSLGNTGTGLYICPYCQQRFVVSQSGHYVRDPMQIKQQAYGQMLRRQSRPLARMRRDFRFGKPVALIALLGSAIFLGWSLVTPDDKPNQPSPVQEMLDWVKKGAESIGILPDR